MNILCGVRFLIGCLFIVSGFEKLLGPYQNFLYVVQGYECFNPFLENIVAHIVPWIELLLGVFLVIGVWLKWALRGVLILFAGFIMILSQAILRKLPITECGCLGELLSFPLHVFLVFDSIFFLITGLLLKKIEKTSVFSLDHYYEKN